MCNRISETFAITESAGDRTFTGGAEAEKTRVQKEKPDRDNLPENSVSITC